MENNRETYGGYQISVIVPVYNVEQYLKRCVDSILAQTAEGLEIILVDDGSTDEERRAYVCLEGGPCPCVRKIHRLCGQRRLDRPGYV